MPLQLLPALAADIPRAVSIERDAYTPNPFSPVLFPGPFPADALTRRAAEVLAQKDADPTTRWLKVVDTDIPGDDGIVAFARWTIYAAGPGPKPAVRALGEGCNAEACEAVFGGVARMHERVRAERSCVYLKLLHTDPKHQRRGAASLLLQSMVDEADKLGLPALLESSEEGHRLYQKYGFKDVEVLEIDLSKWGHGNVHLSWAMVREPKPFSELPMSNDSHEV